MLKLSLRRIGEAELGATSASLAYYALLSLFPMLITAGNLLPLFGLSYNGVSTYLAQVIPEDIMTFINPVIQNLLASTSGGILSIGAVATLWAASLGVNGLKNGFNKAYGVTPPRNFVLQRIISMLMFFTLIVALGAVMIAFAFGRQFLEWLVPILGLSDNWLTTFNAWRWPVTLVALVVVITLIDYFLPNARIKFWTILPGAGFTIAAWLALAQLFATYMHYFGTRYNSYGTIGTFMVLLLWLNFSAMMWLIGAVVNAVVAEYYCGRLRHSRGKVHDFVRRRRVTRRLNRAQR
ncbi:YihY/virulence factor BrkB family protein [Lacticaseibacillus daqingensis]|uniref:YihY/virulence factor BrkB family protein n=1 Tax=Lacticaseibacillus daqingensis TaxID=2486014 RepID=UPI000F775724|nr:YihY/virulence factor BrkB family protein [Lacticaseibacillus daqingensis]